jgi:hypothetical protein
MTTERADAVRALISLSTPRNSYIVYSTEWLGGGNIPSMMGGGDDLRCKYQSLCTLSFANSPT